MLQCKWCGVHTVMILKTKNGDRAVGCTVHSLSYICRRWLWHVAIAFCRSVFFISFTEPECSLLSDSCTRKGCYRYCPSPAPERGVTLSLLFSRPLLSFIVRNWVEVWHPLPPLRQEDSAHQLFRRQHTHHLCSLHVHHGTQFFVHFPRTPSPQAGHDATCQQEKQNQYYQST